MKDRETAREKLEYEIFSEQCFEQEKKEEEKKRIQCDGIDCAWCGEKEPCIYKIANELEEKLLHKTQECNKLYIQLKADEEYHKEEENTLRKIIKNKEERNIELYKENNQLKVKNEKLKGELEAVYDDCKGCPTCNEALYNANLYAKEYRKLKQTLTEIKEIAENTYCLTNYTNKDMAQFAKQILQKISEVEKK